MPGSKRRKVSEVFRNYGRREGDMRTACSWELSSAPVWTEDDILQQQSLDAVVSVEDIEECELPVLDNHQLPRNIKAALSLEQPTEGHSSPRLSVDEVLHRMALVGLMPTQQSLGLVFLQIGKHRLVAVHKGFATTPGSLVNFINGLRPNAQLTPNIFKDSDLFPVRRILRSGSQRSGGMKPPNSVKRSARSLLHEHRALQLADSHGLFAAVETLFRAATLEEIPTSYECARCSLGITTKNGPNDAYQHASECHSDIPRLECTIASCQPCAKIFLTKKDALDHWKECQKLQDSMSPRLAHDLPPYTFRFAVGADRSRPFADTVLCFRADYSRIVSFTIHVLNQQAVASQSFIALLHNIPVAPLPPDAIVIQTPWEYIGLSDDLLATKLHMLKNEYFTIPEAKELAALYNIKDDPSLQALWEFENPSLDQRLVFLNCAECGRPVNRHHDVGIHQHLRSGACEGSVKKVGSQKNRFDGSANTLSHCEACGIMFWCDVDRLHHQGLH